MNSATAPQPALPRWQRELAEGVRSPAELLALLELDPALLPAAQRAQQAFALRVPRGFVKLMRKGDPRDPLLLQILPAAAEDEPHPEFKRDPVGDMHALHGQGLLHKYAGRVLLVATGACAVHCRYCFRRHFPYADASASPGSWQAALDYVAANPDVREVILSGGDPLTLNDRRLSELARGLAQIPHVERLRIHSRLPVVLPSRIDEAFLGWFSGGRLQPVMVIHANHAQELDAEVAAAVARLRQAGVPILNQAVLLRGINDNVDRLAELSERLFVIGALPYYLHLLDRVQGAAHFEVPETRARQLFAELAARLPGYLLPRLAKEEPGQPHKTLVLP
jgi:EF-P beta-lysylation protein EpmB